MSGETSYEPVMDPNQYASMFQNVNPMGTGMATGLFNQMQGAVGQGAPGAVGGMGDFMGAFLGAAPQLQGLAQGAGSDLQQALLSQQQAFMQPAMAGAAGAASNLNAYNSSFTQQLMAREAAKLAMQNASQMQGGLMNMTGNLWGGAMPLFAQQALGVRGQDITQRGQDIQATGQQNQLYSLLAQLVNPNMVAPDIATEYKPGAWDYLSQMLGMGTQLGTAALMGKSA